MLHELTGVDVAGRDPDIDDMLLGLYAKDPIRYLDRAADLTRAMLAAAPHRPEPYKVLRRMYSEAKRRDATWLTCQALTVLGAAETSEMLYFRRYRLSGSIPRTTRITDQECSELVEHPYVDARLTKILRLIEPGVLAARGQSLAELGYVLVVSDDLPSCLAVISTTQKVGNTLSASERGRDLLEYSVSGAYLRLRDRLQLSVDWREVHDIPFDEEEAVNSSPMP